MSTTWQVRDIMPPYSRHHSGPPHNLSQNSLPPLSRNIKVKEVNENLIEKRLNLFNLTSMNARSIIWTCDS